MHSCDSLSTHFSLQCCNYITDTTTSASITHRNCRCYTLRQHQLYFILLCVTWPQRFQSRRFYMFVVGVVRVVGLVPRFHNWMCCKVNKVINVFHQVSHLSRYTALPDNEVREPRSAPHLPAWPNWEAWVSTSAQTGLCFCSSSTEDATLHHTLMEGSKQVWYFIQIQVFLESRDGLLSVMERIVDLTFEKQHNLFTSRNNMHIIVTLCIHF